MNFMTFHSVGNVIIPTDELIFFRGVGIPSKLLISGYPDLDVETPSTEMGMGQILQQDA